MKTFEGKLVSQNIKIGIVAARFNEFITSKLLSGAMDGAVQYCDIYVAAVCHQVYILLLCGSKVSLSYPVGT